MDVTVIYIYNIHGIHGFHWMIEDLGTKLDQPAIRTYKL
jgi:hypothetical protein